MSETENTSLVADKNADEAIHEIATLEDLEVLKSIAETDTRKTVTEAAERRIKKLSQDDTLRETGMVLPGDGRVYQVEIPGCLVGRQHVLASSEDEAEDKYRRPCGMWRNSEPIQVSVTDFDPNDLPEGVTLYGEPEPAHADQ